MVYFAYKCLPSRALESLSYNANIYESMNKEKYCTHSTIQNLLILWTQVIVNHFVMEDITARQKSPYYCANLQISFFSPMGYRLATPAKVELLGFLPLQIENIKILKGNVNKSCLKKIKTKVKCHKCQQTAQGGQINRASKSLKNSKNLSCCHLVHLLQKRPYLTCRRPTLAAEEEYAVPCVHQQSSCTSVALLH